MKSRDKVYSTTAVKHEESSFQTKKMFAEALKEEMKKKPFQKITVSEIVRACGVNRKTFYYHFEDIYKLLQWTFEQEAIEVVKHFDLLSDYEEAILFVMDYIEENDYIISCAYDSIGSDEMKRFFYKDFYEVVLRIIEGAEKIVGRSLDREYKLFLCNFYTEALAGVLIDWVKKEQKVSRRQIIAYLSTTVKASLTAILQSSLSLDGQSGS